MKARTSRFLRGVLWALLGLLAAAVVATGALWLWAGTEGSLATALRWAGHQQPLAAENVSGTLRHGGAIARLVWETDNLVVEARNVRLRWQPWALLSGQLQLDNVSADSLRVHDRRAPAPPGGPPAAIVLPFKLVLDEFTLGRFDWVGPPAFTATGIAGKYEYNGVQHSVQLDSVQIASGRYAGKAALAARGKLELSAQLTGTVTAVLPGGSTLPLSFTAQAGGPLTDLRAEASMQAGTATAPGLPQPRARAVARIMPWAAQPVPEADASFSDLDLAALWPEAPRTQLTGEASARPDASRTDTWRITTTFVNKLSGPWDRQRIPVERLQAQGEWRAGVAAVRSLRAAVAGGEVEARGEWTPPPQGSSQPGWKLDAILKGIDPSLAHSQFAPFPLNGQAKVEGEGTAIAFDAKVQAAGTPARATRKGAEAQLAADLRALRLREAAAQGRWSAGLLQLRTLEVTTDDARLNASLEVRPSAPSGSGTVQLEAPGLRASARGDLRETAGGGEMSVTASDAAQALRWLRRLPGMGSLRTAEAAGRAGLDLRWQGGWRDPAVQVRAGIPSLDWRGPAPSNPATTTVLWQLRDAQATVDGRLSTARVTLQGQVETQGRKLGLQAAAQGGQVNARAVRPWDMKSAIWQLDVTQLALSLQDAALGQGTWRLATQGKVPVRWGPGKALETGAGTALLSAPAGTASHATVQWQPVRWRNGQLATAGKVTGLPLSWIEIFAGPQLAGAGLSGTLVFDGEWDAVLAETLRVRASLSRSGGDLTVLAESAPGVSTRVAAGVKEARITLVNEGDALTLTARWDSERAGTADARLATRLSRSGEGWAWPDDAPLSGQMRAQLPRIGVWSVLAPPGWRLRGSLGANIAVAGTRAEPSLSGTLQADDLALRSVVDGIEFGNGRLRARLDGTRMLIDEFALQGAGDKGAGGTLTAKGEAGWVDSKPLVRLDAVAERLKASIRTDRQVTVSGELKAALQGAAAELTGKLRVDQARILLPDEGTPQLGDDVIVRKAGATAAGAKAPALAASPQADTRSNRSLKLAVQIDLGRDFRVQGKGIDTRVAGNLELTSQAIDAPRLTGTVNTVDGQYRAYGQRLEIDQGVIRFTGAIDNPSLDILAIRPNLTQRVGVQITGTALLPRVRLYASPDLPDAEKLSWLVVGRASASGGAEAALLQQAALALLGSKGGGMSGGLASSLGLDELSFRGSSTNSAGATTEGALTLGKRFSRNFYAAYERSLSGALGTLYVFYDISQRITVRGQTGDQNAVDLIFTFSYD